MYAKSIHEMLVGVISDASDGYNINVQDNVRFISVSTHCQEAREMKGINIKEASFILKIPQYRLKAIESGGVSGIRPNDLHAYIKYLDLDKWYKRWKYSNNVLVKKYDLI
jgi:hypothetical protein